MTRHLTKIFNHHRFTCWRQGHDPMYVVHSSSTITFETYRTVCSRCGCTYELAPRPLGTTTDIA